MTFSFKSTKKGLLHAEFRDRFGALCSAQESSFPDEDCLWLGVDVDIHGEEVTNGRMHLSRALAYQLLPILRHFIRTGQLGEDIPSQEFRVGMWLRGVGVDNADVQGRIIAMDASGFTVQDNNKLGLAGQMSYGWEVAHLYWETTETPPPSISRYALITTDDSDDT